MTQILLFAVLGLASGAVYAGLGMGLITVFKGSGVISFAQAGIALWGAFTFQELTSTGRLVLPVLLVPDSISLGGPQPVPVALALGVASSVVIGMLTYLLIFRPLRDASIVARITASVGLLTLLNALIVRRFGDGGRQAEPILPSDSLALGGLEFSQDRLWMLALTVVIALAVAAFFRWSLMGLATRASVDGTTPLTLSGWSVDRLALMTWAVGAGIPALLISLASPITGLDPTNAALLVAPGLAAMLVGRMSSVLVAAAAGVGLGVLESLVTYWQLQPWWPDAIPAGTTESLPFIVIVAMLVFAGRTLPGRGHIGGDRLPAVLRRTATWKGIGIGVVATVALTYALGADDRSGLVLSMIFAIMALSFVVLIGLVGQVSLGQAGVAGVAAFALVRVTHELPFPLSILAAAVVGSVAGVLTGLPALRIRGAQLAVVTLAGAIAVEKLILQHIQAEPGSAALSGPSLGPLDLSMQSGADYARPSFVLTVLVFLVACIWLVARVIAGRSGRRLLAVRSNERAAASVGIDVARTKMWAFALSAFLAGIAGALLAYSRGTVSAGGFNFFTGLTYLLYAFLGGITSVGGALFAGFFAPQGLGYVILQRFLEVGSFYDIVGGLGLILASIFQPRGAVGALADQVAWVRNRVGRPRPAPELPIPASAALPRRDTSDRPALEIHDLSVSYGGVKAVQGVDLLLRPGTIHGLIGPNGAGKTSTLDAITGFAAHTGHVHLDGRSIDGWATHRRQQAGLARTWQAGEIFTDLTVLENLLVASDPGRYGDLIRDLVGRARGDGEQAAAALHLLDIAELAHRSAGEVSTGQLKLVGVARALASAPLVLLADEPAAGLDSAESAQLGRRLRAIAETGVGVLLIEHDLPLVMSICDEVTVLDFGKVIAHGAPGDVATDTAVLAAYVGTNGTEPATGEDEPVLPESPDPIPQESR